MHQRGIENPVAEPPSQGGQHKALLAVAVLIGTRPEGDEEICASTIRRFIGGRVAAMSLSSSGEILALLDTSA